MLVIYQIYCHELSEYWSSLVQYKSRSSTSQHIHRITDNKKSLKQKLSLFDLRVLNELNKLKSLTFYCTFDVIRICIGNKFKKYIIYL